MQRHSIQESKMNTRYFINVSPKSGKKFHFDASISYINKYRNSSKSKIYTCKYESETALGLLTKVTTDKVNYHQSNTTSGSLRNVL